MKEYLHPSLSKQAQAVLIYPQVTNKSLLSVRQLTADGCEVHIHNQNVNVIKNNTNILQGTKIQTTIYMTLQYLSNNITK